MIKQIIAQASQLNFYKAVFLIENQLKKHGLEYRCIGYDCNPKQELIRFSATQKFGFPGNAITKLESTSYHDGLEQVKMEVSFMGLTGCSGALPHFYSELVMQRLRYKDTTMRDFYDMFNHRLISLYYRAWKKYKPTLNYLKDDTENDPYSSILALLSGGKSCHQIHFSGLYSRKVRNAADLQNILTYYLSCDVHIKQLVGQWRPLKLEEQTKLASQNQYEGQHARLGVDAMIGKQVWDIASLIEIIISPSEAEQTKRLLPRRDLFKLAQQIVNDYLGNAVQSKIIIKSNFNDLDAVKLVNNDYQLGCNSFLAANKNQSHKSLTKLSFKG
ncbi:type VI secretion system baseplate subunit TssG [Pseudoalteromonas mariniglutinosa]|uniref:type VI secretion system baseplate subunit TssG n=1 Tax=Pseudoalteromonas mariniglutinosa TaxID=206042 RepID=UPI00384EFE5B